MNRLRRLVLIWNQSYLNCQARSQLPRIKETSTDGATPYVDKPDQVQSLAQRLNGQRLIAFDTEFLWERTYSPHLGLIQVADFEQTWLIDPVRLSPKQMQPLLDVFVAPETLKVAHAVDQDQICLHMAYGVVAEPVLDTAAAAALVGLGDQVGLSKLLHHLLRIEIAKGYSRTNWLKRPLSEAMLRYAAEDVAHLPKAADVLSERLGDLGRTDWALELSARGGHFAQAHFDSNALARKLADGRRLDATTFSVLRELIAWRESTAQRSDVPRKWVSEDKILVKLASARPTTPEQLADFRGLGGIKNANGVNRILSAIRKGIDTPTDDYVVAKRKPSTTQTESAALVVLKCFLNTLAADNQIPVRLLADSDQMVELLRGKFKDVEALRQADIMDARAVDLVGEDLVAILNGSRGLRIINGAPVQHID